MEIYLRSRGLTDEEIEELFKELEALHEEEEENKNDSK